ncbi:MAG: hypothetical protein B7Z66_06975 [Chromatiales bacterium 21-64-14]|nr:MAG: hypothetical protein B7Z66_06975 [Chromatiales bacterium 21-64-14]HQU16844.1 hypothetical protein [Gammaproteobacteria bacterium]
MNNDPLSRFHRDHPQRPDARIVEGRTGTGRSCRIVDNTATVAPAELAALLQDLIRAQRFGLGGHSTGPDHAITIGGPVGTHIQLDGRLYRLLVFPYEARIEDF